MILKKNVGYLDSVLRVILGVIIVTAGFYYNTYWGLLGLILVISGAVSYCPVYRILGMETTLPNIEREN